MHEERPILYKFHCHFICCILSKSTYLLIISIEKKKTFSVLAVTQHHLGRGESLWLVHKHTAYKQMSHKRKYQLFSDVWVWLHQILSCKILDSIIYCLLSASMTKYQRCLRNTRNKGKVRPNAADWFSKYTWVHNMPYVVMIFEHSDKQGRHSPYQCRVHET